MERCNCCGYKVDDYEQNHYGDIFCSTCWELKGRFPIKTNQEIGRLKPYYLSDDERARAFSKLALIILVIVFIGITMSILL